MSKKTLETFTLLAGLAGSFILLGWLLAGPSGIVIGAVSGSGLVGVAYRFSDRLAVDRAGPTEARIAALLAHGPVPRSR